MKKTSVYLSEREERKLAALSRRLGRPRAEIVREAIASYDPAPPERTFASFDSFDSGRGPGGSIADVPDEELMEGFGEDSLGR